MQFRINGEVGNVRDRPRQECARGHAAPTGGKREKMVDGVELFRRPAVMGHEMDQRAVEPEDAAGGTAERGSAGRDGVKGRLQVRRRAGDDAENLGRGGLLVQRLPRLGQEPRILHRDDRLVGKGAHQLDLPLGERLDPRAGEHDDTDRLAFAQ
jgi:hypothetical protein